MKRRFEGSKRPEQRIRLHASLPRSPSAELIRPIVKMAVWVNFHLGAVLRCALSSYHELLQDVALLDRWRISWQGALGLGGWVPGGSENRDRFDRRRTTTAAGRLWPRRAAADRNGSG